MKSLEEIRKTPGLRVATLGAAGGHGYIDQESGGRIMNEHDATEQAYRNGYVRGREDAAREIFADFGKLRCTNDEDYAEYCALKKKYTEDENDG